LVNQNRYFVENASFEAPSKDMLAWRLLINEMRTLSVLAEAKLNDVFS
jgi:hypothetical protein